MIDCAVCWEWQDEGEAAATTRLIVTLKAIKFALA